MSKIDDYKFKKSLFDGLNDVVPNESMCTVPGPARYHCVPGFIRSLHKNIDENPCCDWFYKAICKNWGLIKTTMEEVGVVDVNQAKIKADKEAQKFLGLV